MYRRAFLLGAKQGGHMHKIPARTRKPTREGVDDPPTPARLAYHVDEACALLGVSRDTIERAVKAGRLRSPSYSPGGI
jgi:excisionase family DNA binding protein